MGSTVLLARGVCACAMSIAGPVIVGLQGWLREQRANLSRNNDTTKAISYCLSRCDAFTRFLDNGRLLHVEQCGRTQATGRRCRTKKLDLAGSDEGGGRGAAIYTPSSRPLSSTTSVYRLGSLTCWHACRSPCQAHSRTPALELAASRRLNAVSHPPRRLTRGRRRMRTIILGDRAACLEAEAGCGKCQSGSVEH